MKVLIIEDDNTVATHLKECISPITSDITITSTLREAFIEMERSEYAVITLDLGLPDSMPHETIRQVQEIKESNPQCLLVIVSGYKQEELPFQDGLDGADGFIFKPAAIRSPSNFLDTFVDLCRSIIRNPKKYQANSQTLCRFAQHISKNEPTHPPKHGFLPHGEAFGKWSLPGSG